MSIYKPWKGWSTLGNSDIFSPLYPHCDLDYAGYIFLLLFSLGCLLSPHKGFPSFFSLLYKGLSNDPQQSRWWKDARTSFWHGTHSILSHKLQSVDWLETSPKWAKTRIPQTVCPVVQVRSYRTSVQDWPQSAWGLLACTPWVSSWHT